LLEAHADDAADRLELALDQEPHRERGGVPAARGEALEDRGARGRFVQMERLRIELCGEGLDLLYIDGEAARSEGLANRVIFEVLPTHRSRSPPTGARLT